MEFDGIVIGGGPAGMFAAICAAERGNRVLLLEKNDRLGKKLLITGKGRCNVTNFSSAREVLENIPRNSRFLYSCMQAFPPESVMAFFEEAGCSLKVERGNRVFPTSDRSASVLEALRNRMHRLGVCVTKARVTEICRDSQGIWRITSEKESYCAEWVILATGGLSYPATGSTGDGYALAQAQGHTLVQPEGSLVPLEEDGTLCARMQGLSLRNIEVKLTDEKGKLLYKDFGELLFTHFGLSGPTILSASCHLKGEGCRVLIDLKPALEESKLDARLLRDLDMYRNRSMENALTDLLPRSMIPVILELAGVDPLLQANSLTKQQRHRLLGLLKAFPVKIRGKRPVEEAIITSGGIKVSEVDPKTMESKLAPGLYFAGEILDCDGYTGGFNLQIAWATAHACGCAVKPAIDKKPGM